MGGDFTNAAGIATADYVAEWNGSAWSALGANGSGGGAINNYVFALAVSGSNLYVGGAFTNAAGMATADYCYVEWHSLVRARLKRLRRWGTQSTGPRPGGFGRT